MDIFSVIKLAGGLALFLFGMSILGSNLEKISSGRMEKILENLTSNIFKSVLLGALVTAAVQSSSATTVIVVGLVNAGILKLGSAVGVIMGANIGTTITAQMLRLGDLENNQSVNVFLKLLKPSTLAPLVAVIGILLFMTAHRNKAKTVGEILLGFGILFNGLFAMETAVAGLKDIPQFTNLFLSLRNPVLGVLVGAIVTALIQSSSASIAILQTLSTTGAITFSSAFPIIMGQNIGTCITPIMSSIGANKNAKRTAMVHLYFNIIGTLFFLIVVYAIQHLVGFGFWNSPIDRGGIANFHTIFNVVVTLCFIPFWRVLDKLAIMTIRNSPEDNKIELEENNLDKRFFISPSIAVQQAQKTVIKMGKLAQSNFKEMRTLFNVRYDQKTVDRINEYENTIDKLEDRLNQYLLEISGLELTENESKTVTALLHLLSEYERIGDYTINIVECSERLYNDNISFSEEALSEFNLMCDAIEEIIQLAIDATISYDIDTAMNIEPLEEVIDQLVDTFKTKHIKRFKMGICAVESGVNYLDILTNLERISDHCSNIGVYLIIRISKNDTLNRHEYVDGLHNSSTEHYIKTSKMYLNKYKLEQ